MARLLASDVGSARDSPGTLLEIGKVLFFLLSQKGEEVSGKETFWKVRGATGSDTGSIVLAQKTQASRRPRIAEGSSRLA